MALWERTYKEQYKLHGFTFEEEDKRSKVDKELEEIYGDLMING